MKNKRFFQCSIFLLLFTLISASGFADTIKVNFISSLQEAINNASPGDQIIVANGVYTTSESILIKSSGTASQPITIEAETTGGVEINGANGFMLFSPSSYIIIKGFRFTHKTGTNRIEPGATHCLITRNVFECAPAGSPESKPYLNISGDDNEISYNIFQNKKDEGQMISVQGPGGDKMAKRTWIHHNYFYNFPPTANNCSAIQIGLSGRSMDSAFCVVEYNLFVKTEGENEGAICHKSCNNIIRYNTFGERSEEMSLRHGNNSQVYGNFFLNTTGLRFSGDDHLIYNNYFQGCSKAIVCTNGDGEVKDGSKLTCHDRADRVKVVFNTIIDCESSFQMPGRNNGLGATNITFANNIIQGGESVSVQGIYPDPVWKGNIIWNTTGGSIPSDGFRTINPNLQADKSGIYHLSQGSPAIGAGIGNYPFVTIDVDGQIRGGLYDTGSDQYSRIPVTNRPLTISDVGPSAGIKSSPLRLDLASPNGTLHCLLVTDKDQLVLSVTMNGKLIVEQSPLLMSVDGVSITNGAKAGKIRKFSANETYPLFGLHSVAKDNYNGASVALTHVKSGIKYTLETKVFNDAVAFRFVVAGDEYAVRKPDESTVFTLPKNCTVWFHDLYMHYEGIHSKKMIDTIPAGQWAAPPLMVKLPEGNGYVAITEANLVNYAGMALQSDGKNGFTVRLGHSHPASYPYVLRYPKEDVERLSKIAEVKGTITTPWRLVIAGKDLNTMVNSDAVYNLCSPPDKTLFPEGAKTEWVKPGRAVWKYLDGGGDGTLKVMKEFSKGAGELGFEYNVLEGFWSRWPDDSIRALIDYSKKLGIGIIVWKHSNTLHDQKARQELFQRCHDLGIAGLKIDFFDHEAKEVVDLYETILKETAALKLVCIFHGADKPTGLWRTWPNAVIYEGVKGMEASKLMDRATHETTIPFTRMLAGPADYSVCHFGDRRRNTTWVHQAATAAIYSAPVITYAATPAHILENPCSEMIKSIPSVWDETIVLPPSEIGELAIYVQRKGTTWFLSVINGLQPKRMKIPLSFLGNGSYNTLVLNDNPENTAAAVISNGMAKQNDFLNVNLGEGGGFMTRFTLKQ